MNLKVFTSCKLRFNPQKKAPGFPTPGLLLSTSIKKAAYSRPLKKRFRLISVPLGFVRSVDFNADVLSLFFTQCLKCSTNLSKVKPCNLFIKVFGQNVYFVLIIGVIKPE